MPISALEAGHTYRARVRMKDSTGRWSHWSNPLEFLATESESPITLAISEFNYHPPDNPNLVDPEDLEYIEMLNYGNETVSLAGVQLTEFASPEVYTFDSSFEPRAGRADRRRPRSDRFPVGLRHGDQSRADRFQVRRQESVQ